MPVIQRSLDLGFSLIERLPLVNGILSISYVNSGVQIVSSFTKPVVEKLDSVIENAIDRFQSMRASMIKKAIESREQVSVYVNGAVNRYNKEKDEVIVKAKGYQSAISEQIQVIKSENAVITAKVKQQAPEMVKKAVSLTKQGLEISIGQEKTETVINTVKTHTPRFVTSFIEASVATSVDPTTTTVEAH